MLAEDKLKILQDLVANSSKEELIWINGYLSAIVKTTSEEVIPVKPSTNKVTIAYGTETGNSKKIAGDFASKARKSGINAKLVSLDQYRLNDLSKEEYFLTVISTQGDGDPPPAAKKFYDHIHQNGFQFNQLKYGVLALGDTAYPLFCKTGEDVDSQLSKLGGQRIVPLRKCDTDYETDAAEWFSQVLEKISGNGNGSSNGFAKVSLTEKPKRSTGKKLYEGTILTNINLNDLGSNKQTHHIEISAEGIDYQPGDSIGIVPENPAKTVEKIIQQTGVDRERLLSFRNEKWTVSDLLKNKLNIYYLPERVVRQYGVIVQQNIPETKIGLDDLLNIYPVKDAAQFEEVMSILEPITPRLYSIASSAEAHSGEVHITVARDSFKVHEGIKYGLCSDYLLKLNQETSLKFYVHKNSQFKLPAADKDIIMIGPGTGIAPFRSFLAEREATGANGRNWLFFGEQHFFTDFLYQTEIQNWVQTGVLTKVNVAFSRDQEQKVYVQHKMLRHGSEFFEWLEEGAYVFVCGSKEPMSVDVENSLLQIIEKFGERSEQQALEYIDQLKDQGRYLKDVY